MGRFLRALIGLALTAVATVAAMVLIAVERVMRWRDRRRDVARQAQLHREIVRVRQLADEQREAALHGNVREIDLARLKQQRDPIAAANQIMEEDQLGKR